MRVRIGCRLQYDFVQPTPLIAMLNVHYSRFGDLEQADYLVTSPSVSLESYRDGFGNWCTRMLAPAGEFTLSSSGIFRDTGQPDPTSPAAQQHNVEDLPFETLVFLLGSRYCDTDILSEEAWQLFEGTIPGWARVQAICDHVHQTIRFDYMKADATRTASQALSTRHGVCRDFAHLAITFCRCMNIPARYCTGYLSDIGEPEPHPAGDFAAWMEVFLDGRWWVFDPRNNTRRTARILIARGRDAADVPLTQTFGPNTLTGFQVWTEEAEPTGSLEEAEAFN
ncbi:transglutaminase-like domain-containing protein [Alloyangia pacifica]|uniref:Transglutaminase-like enzyme, putative cysteine protease n=1 Tax=Alloyangia pacifica TaxID=311180 RepID=A0A1I6V2C7_9RHOB|nr:transglutaminase family protein [Alloyangia pacifica]SDI88811.1 Transglutaminase-like enzyme, putative cysteine protease [Alloyangia pacifica]SFT07766.1 Transglutaminase-like enzyme, putative cysteine protease [Alloyangia pacifica]